MCWFMVVCWFSGRSTVNRGLRKHEERATAQLQAPAAELTTRIEVQYTSGKNEFLGSQLGRGDGNHTGRAVFVGGGTREQEPEGCMREVLRTSAGGHVLAGSAVEP